MTLTEWQLNLKAPSYC